MHFYQLITDNIKDAKGSCIALLGGGGKTALLHKLANEFAQFYPSVLQTSLTKTAFDQSDNPIILNEIDTDKLDSIKLDKNPLFLIGDKITNDKLKGISETVLDRIRRQFDITIFECDGARNKPLKAHTEYDPQVPGFSTQIIIIVGADSVNTKINDGYVHRPELFCKKWNVKPSFQISIDFIVKVLTSEKGYHSKIVNNSNIIYFVNKWDHHRVNAEKLAQAICHKTGKPTFFGSVQKNVLNQVLT